MSTNPFDDLDDGDFDDTNPFGVVADRRPPVPHFSPASPLQGAAAVPARLRAGSKDSAGLDSSMLGSDMDPNHIALPYVVDLKMRVDEHAPAIAFHSHQQYCDAVTRPLGDAVHKYMFVHHPALKTYQLQHAVTGTVLLAATKRTDGLKFASAALNFSIIIPSSPDKIPFKLRGNTGGSEFVLYDDGFNPNKLDRFGALKQRCELALIRVATLPKVMSRRSYTLTIPREECAPFNVKDGLLSLDSTRPDKVYRFASNVPGSPGELPVAMDYHGLAADNSIKNMILHRADRETAGDEVSVSLVNGKQTKHMSIVLATGQVSPLVAFATTLTAWVSLNVPSKQTFGLHRNSGQEPLPQRLHDALTS